MSNTPETLPVVDAFIDTLRDNMVGGRAHHYTTYDDDIPAIAVPDALWSDAGFHDKVNDRLPSEVGECSLSTILAAIHAELAHRAGRV